MFTKGWPRKVLVALGTILVTLGAFIVFDTSDEFTWGDDQTLADVDTASVDSVELKPVSIFYGMEADSSQVIASEVKRNQRFTDLLKDHYVNPRTYALISTLPRDVFDFRRVAAGKRYTILFHNDSLKSARALIYEQSPVDYYVFHFSDTLVVESCSRPVDVVEKSIAAEIKSSLSETIEAMNISHELTNRFVDIFAWQVDFQRLQVGDKFKLIYTERQVDGTTIGIERIEGVHFEHSGSRYYAIPFDQCDGIDYFDEQGNSLRKALLKYPIEFTRISSRFNPNRFHPVAKVFRAHRGTDFAAPAGTPIRTAGDGIVEEAQYKSNNGNYVKIRHNNTYSTQYLHMSKIAAGIRPGMRVRQGQTIGFVGSTGLATGPHLCYRFWKNGVQVDALKVDLPAAQPVRADMREAFEDSRKAIIKRLEGIPFPDSPAEIALD